ncbi:hypothetical protein FPV67DRAFT_1672671 [Lyophyllum atratum]|nr:hypothetical protein FPV67DRAFT_1672671 [Lyophyllum atratum]
MRFPSIFFLASFAFSAFAAKVEDVVNDLTGIQAELNTLDAAIQKFPVTNGNLFDALPIHLSVLRILPLVSNCITHTATVPMPITLADGQKILTAVEDIVPFMVRDLGGVVARKDAFTRLDIIGGLTLAFLPFVGKVPINLVRQDIRNLKTAVSTLQIAFLAASPPEILPRASALSAEVDDAFADAIAQYGA